MASTVNTTTAFIAKLLAPIADGDEQADTKKYRRQIERDLLAAWTAGMERIRLAEAAQTIAWEAFRVSGERYITDGGTAGRAVLQAGKHKRQAEVAQCLIPAPTAAKARWKLKILTNEAAAETPEFQAALAADERRFAE